MPRFFLEELDESDVCITGPDARHIGLALRMRVGEMLTVCAYGRDYQCRIRSITPEEVHLDVVSSELCAAEPSVSLTLYQAVPKADKLEQIIQKSDIITGKINESPFSTGIREASIVIIISASLPGLITSGSVRKVTKQGRFRTVKRNDCSPLLPQSIRSEARFPDITSRNSIRFCFSLSLPIA